MAGDQGDKILELQSLRGIAAVVVLWSHALATFSDTPANLALAVNGRGAVLIFFILSGFVLTLSLKAPLSFRHVLKFYHKRLFRIFPAILAASLMALAYVALVDHPIAGGSEFYLSNYKKENLDILHILASFLTLSAFLIPPIWSIFVELLASVMMPFIAHCARYRRHMFWAITLLLLPIAYFFGPTSRYQALIYMPLFAAGAAMLFLRVKWSARMGLPLLAICTMMGINYFLPYDLLSISIQGIASFIIVASINTQRPALLRWPPLVWMGDISYSIYLIHFPIMCFLAHYVHGGVMLGIATTLVTLPVSWLLYEYVELPGIKLGKLAWDRCVAFRQSRGARFS